MRIFLTLALVATAALLSTVAIRSSVTSPSEGSTSVVVSPGGEAAQPVYSIIDVNTYDVEGTTEQEILRSLHERGPRSGEFFGLMESEMAYRFWKTPSDTGCRLEQIRLDLHLVITLPRWVPPADAPYDLRRDWARFETALRRHEDDHRKIAERDARETYHALRSLRTPTCDTIEQEAQAITERLRIESDQRQQHFDRQTRHGRTQGAIWPQP